VVSSVFRPGKHQGQPQPVTCRVPLGWCETSAKPAWRRTATRSGSSEPLDVARGRPRGGTWGGPQGPPRGLPVSLHLVPKLVARHSVEASPDQGHGVDARPQLLPPRPSAGSISRRRHDCRACRSSGVSGLSLRDTRGWVTGCRLSSDRPPYDAAADARRQHRGGVAWPDALPGRSGERRAPRLTRRPTRRS
jgi:hypothetical protein